MDIKNSEQILSDIKIDMLLSREIFGIALSRMELSIDYNKSDNALAYTDGERIRIYAQWFEVLTYKNLVAIIAHELMHIFLNHLTRRDGRNPIIWNFACDYVVNWELKNNKTNGKIDPIGDLPTNTLYDDKFEGMSAEEIYDYLMENGDKFMKMSDEPFDFSSDNRYEYGDGVYVEDLRKVKIDNHEESEIPDEVQNKIISELSSDLEKAMSKNNCPSCLIRTIPKLKSVNYNWKEILIRYMKTLNNPLSTWRRPSRRGLSIGVYLPGIKKQDGLTIGVGIDTSGSISEETLIDMFNCIYTALGQIKNLKVYMWMFSGIVHEGTFTEITPKTIDKLNDITPESNMSTDIIANVRFVNSKKELKDIDCLILMTDGIDILNDMKYDGNLIWTIVDNESFRNPQGCRKGKVIYLPRHRFYY